MVSIIHSSPACIFCAIKKKTVSWYMGHMSPYISHVAVMDVHWASSSEDLQNTCIATTGIHTNETAYWWKTYVQTHWRLQIHATCILIHGHHPLALFQELPIAEKIKLFTSFYFFSHALFSLVRPYGFFSAIVVSYSWKRTSNFVVPGG